MSTNAPSTSITVTQDEEIPMTSTLPKGWHALEANGFSLSYNVSSDPEDSLYHNAVNAHRYRKAALREIFALYGDLPVTIDVAEWARSDRIGSEELEGNSHVEDLPPRMIGGAPAYGHTFIDSTKETPVRRWEWLVGRPDGVWRILATSTSTSPDMPVDVALVINTITWTPTTTTPHSSAPSPTH
ncbi:hypothetical protein [Schaalia hyovaginalis]|uniref:Uncharacterized protein n=1 Tax=Schaalia hyovaginalis TaxID=29316 RepID=A0A923IX28_9ACTO|nr:hypothetical protein [Schaalia hyovaginalis]MBB6333968.1 hypothetical protein [Schaalia hyovaginalis]